MRPRRWRPRMPGRGRPAGRPDAKSDASAAADKARLKRERRLHLTERDTALMRGAAAASTELERIAKTDLPIVAGPFIAEIGYETLYWIPFLNAFCAQFGIPRERMTAISRGGVASWYTDLAATYTESFDHASQADLKRALRQRVADGGSQKQMTATDFEREIVERTREEHALGEVELLHPGLMYASFMPFWRHLRPLSLIRKRSLYRLLPDDPPSPDEIRALNALPTDFVAMKVYSTPVFPANDENRAFVAELIERLTRHTHVVLLSTDVEVDDHEDYAPDDRNDRLVQLRGRTSPGNNLAIQSAVIRRARALYTNFGGFAHLGPFLGTSTVAFYSAMKYQHHHTVMWRAIQVLRAEHPHVGYVSLDSRDFPLLDPSPTASGARR